MVLRMTLLERLRVDRGLSQAEVERFTGVDHKTLIKYEQGLTARVSAATLAKLGEFYEVPASQILLDLRQFVADRELPDAA
jgi:transcriptional regulator with XRE-family HTH domain